MLGEVDRGARSIQSSEKKSRQDKDKHQENYSMEVKTGQSYCKCCVYEAHSTETSTHGRPDGRTDASLTSQKTH